MTPTQKIINEAIDIEELTEALHVEDIDVIDAAKRNPDLLFKAYRYRVKKMRAKRKALSKLEMLKSDLALEIRKRDRIKGRKRTESNIKELILQKVEYQEALEAVHKAEEEEELAKGLVASFTDRGRQMKVISDLVGYEVTLDRRLGDAEGYKKAKDMIRTKYPGGAGLDDVD